MSGHHGAAHGGHDEIHLPPPSLSPATLGLGVMLLSFGVLWGIPLLVAGAVLFVIGLATWLIDDAKAYAQGGDTKDEAHGRPHH